MHFCCIFVVNLESRVKHWCISIDIKVARGIIPALPTWLLPLYRTTTSRPQPKERTKQKETNFFLPFQKTKQRHNHLPKHTASDNRPAVKSSGILKVEKRNISPLIRESGKAETCRFVKRCRWGQDRNGSKRREGFKETLKLQIHSRQI